MGMVTGSSEPWSRINSTPISVEAAIDIHLQYFYYHHPLDIRTCDETFVRDIQPNQRDGIAYL